MLILSRKRGQNTAEYAILIALVVAAAIAMQTYLKRGLQRGVEIAVNNLSNSEQYEPYYLETEATTTTGVYTDTEQTLVGGSVGRTFGDKTTTRASTQITHDTTEAD